MQCSRSKPKGIQLELLNSFVENKGLKLVLGWGEVEQNPGSMYIKKCILQPNVNNPFSIFFYEGKKECLIAKFGRFWILDPKVSRLHNSADELAKISQLVITGHKASSARQLAISHLMQLPVKSIFHDKFCNKGKNFMSPTKTSGAC